MKSKQLIGILVTGAVIITVGVTGVAANVFANRFIAKQTSDKDNIISNAMSSFSSSSVDLPEKDFVGVVNVSGVIQKNESSEDIFSGESSGYNHTATIDYIDKMIKTDNNKGILLYVNSPGGTVYDSDDLYLKLKEYKETTNRPVWAYFAEEACSGGYYISMAADKIYANRNTWTGSIGVIVSLLNYKELYDKLGIKEIDITSGKNKAMGSAGLDMTDEQRQILQSVVDESYEQFVSIVADGRKKSVDEVKPIADGRIYTALQAKEKGLLDEIGSLDDEKAAFTAENNLPENIKFYEPKFDTVWSQLISFSSAAAEKFHAKTESDLIADIVENKGKGVLMYYAK